MAYAPSIIYRELTGPPRIRLARLNIRDDMQDPFSVAQKVVQSDTTPTFTRVHMPQSDVLEIEIPNQVHLQEMGHVLISALFRMQLTVFTPDPKCGQTPQYN